MEIARKDHREDYSDLPQDALTLIRSYVIEKIAGHKYLFLLRDRNLYGGYKHIVHDPKEIDKIENILRHLSNQGLL
jgi:hypothetical protein